MEKEQLKIRSLYKGGDYVEMARRKKKWIPKNLKKGAFKAYCRRLGYSGVTQECIERGKKSKNPTIRRRAVLAETFRKMSRKRKKRR